MAKVNFDLQPFRVPEYVSVVIPPASRQDGMTESPKYHIADLPDEVLEEMYTQFRTDVFARKAARKEIRR